MEYLLNGDIYLKVKPDILHETNEEKISIIDKIIMYINAQTGYEIKIPDEIISDEVSSLNYIIAEINDLDESVKSLISDGTKRLINSTCKYVLNGGYEELLGISGESIIDYSGCDSFWILLTNGYNSALVQSNNPNNVKLCNNKPSNKFVRLFDFLMSSTFIGMNFRRTLPLIHKNDRDYSFVNPKYYNYLILYGNNDLLLAKELTENEYFLIDRKYFQDRNYEFYGQKNTEYTIERVYKEIIDQLSNNNKKTL